MTRKASPALLALTASALALPGLNARAQVPVDTQTQYRFSSYRENSIAADKTLGADTQRYKIETHQFRLLHPLSHDKDLAVDLTRETLSGASPWFIVPDTNRRPIQVMSGATIAEQRTDVNTALTRYKDGTRLRGSAGYSKEDDYRALNLGTEYEWDTDDASTWSLGAGGSWDRLSPTDGASARFPARIANASRHSVNTYGGYSTALNPNTALQLGVTLGRLSGFLSDPYKLASVNGTAQADRRPEDRSLLAATSRLRYFVDAANAAVHADYRLYRDTWRITAHTLEAAWLQNLPSGWLLTPSLRWYSQDAAYFYAPFYDSTRGDGLASSDYRLSDYRALSLRLGALKRWEQLMLDVSVERYRSSHGDNPSLVDFDIVSLGLSYAFF